MIKSRKNSQLNPKSADSEEKRRKTIANSSLNNVGDTISEEQYFSNGAKNVFLKVWFFLLMTVVHEGPFWKYLEHAEFC